MIPKPPDWGSYINICGFAFLKASSSYKPPEDLVKFIEAGPPPIYIGFGSIVVDNPSELTELIFAAVKQAGVRAIVSKGWGGLGGEGAPENVFLLGNCPHDWLFQYVSCVVHHGGAGTSAIGIAMGKPTVIVPFFGDQPFWGAMIYRAGAGPEPVPYKKLTAAILAESITRALQSDIQLSVKHMSEKIAGEDGAAGAAASFHQSLNYDSMRCLLSPDRVAVWRVRGTNLRLSGFAASTLIDNGFIKLKDLRLYCSNPFHHHLKKETNDFQYQTSRLVYRRRCPEPALWRHSISFKYRHQRSVELHFLLAQPPHHFTQRPRTQLALPTRTTSKQPIAIGNSSISPITLLPASDNGLPI